MGRILEIMMSLRPQWVFSVWNRFKQWSRWRKAIVIGIVLILIGFGLYQYQKATKPPEYELTPATVGSITEVVTETGNVTVTGALPTYSTTTGIVEKVLVENGDVVKKDAPLFSVTSSASKQEKDLARSNYLAAKAAWETAKATQLSLQAAMFGEWDAYKELAESDQYEEGSGAPKNNERSVAEFHVPQKEWLAAEASYKKQQVVVDQSAANMNSSWQTYQATLDSTVKAILEGEIRNLSIAPGDAVTVYSALTASTNPPALVIFNPSATAIVKIDVGETDAIKVQPGQATKIEFDAIQDKIFSGKVDRVDSIANPTAGVVKYAVYISLDEPVESLKGGMTADVDITVTTKDNVLTVPSSAIKPHEGGRAVRVVGKKGEIEYVPVTIGAKGEKTTEIVSGISAGTEVIVSLKNEQIKRTGLF